MKEQSLHQIMNAMVQRLETIRPADAVARPVEVLSELEAFIRIDDLLASLNKQYLDAKSDRKEIVALNGADDAMAEVAIDMEDSAWCAMQTRYIELREKRELMARAQQMMRRSEKDVLEERAKKATRKKEKTYQAFIFRMQLLRRVKELNETPHILEWAILFLMFHITPFDKKPVLQQSFAA